MRTIAFLFSMVAVSFAATIITMDNKDFEKVMMEHMASQVNMNPMIGIMALMDHQHQPQEEPEVVEAEGEEDAHDGAEEPADDLEDVEAVEAEDPRPHLNMFNKEMTGVIFPDMMTGATPYSARQPNQRPAGSNHELANGNGKKGGGSAATASATSFSRGPNSFSNSQAQAFSRDSK